MNETPDPTTHREVAIETWTKDDFAVLVDAAPAGEDRRRVLQGSGFTLYSTGKVWVPIEVVES